MRDHALKRAYTELRRRAPTAILRRVLTWDGVRFVLHTLLGLSGAQLKWVTVLVIFILL